MEHVIAERTFAEPVSLEAIEEALRKNESCLTALRVRHLRSSVSLDGLRMICEYEAPDAETVRTLSQRLGVPYERVWSARIYTRGG